MEEKNRYTNRNGLQFYISNTEVYEIGSRSCYGINFDAYPKKNYFESKIKIHFVLLVSREFVIDTDISDYRDEFIIQYGLYEFLKWLNEINESRSETKEMKIFSGDPEVLSKISNGRLQLPVNDEDDERLQKIAEETILKKFYNNRSDKIFSDEDLKERCFVPNYIFNHTYNLLKRQDFLDLDDFQLTSKGISYYKNTNNFDLSQSQFSKTVFVAQSFSSDLLDFYESIYKPIISDEFKLNPILISNEEFDENIDSAILTKIKQSRFLICDLTYSSPFVYFEAGYALGSGVKIIFTCRLDHNSDEPVFDATKFKVHFDVRNRKISWWSEDKIEEFKEDLRNRIKNFLGIQNQNK